MNTSITREQEQDLLNNYKFNLRNTKEINTWADMGEWARPIDNFIEDENLPSFCYPELFQYFTVHKGAEIVTDDEGTYVELKDYVEYRKITAQIRQMNTDGTLFFQRKNSRLTEAEQETRKCEYELAQAKIAYKKALDNELTETVMRDLVEV